MRLDEIEESGKELKNEADSLLEEAQVNFAQVEKLRQMHMHLKELSYDVESTSLQEARDEATRAQAAYEEGKSFLGEAIYSITGKDRPAWSESNPRMQAIFAKAQEHLTRLEKAQKQLQEGHQVLERIDQ
jgi:hypothetical protein